MIIIRFSSRLKFISVKEQHEKQVTHHFIIIFYLFYIHVHGAHLTFCHPLPLDAYLCNSSDFSIFSKITLRKFPKGDNFSLDGHV